MTSCNGSESLCVSLCLEGFLYIFTTNCSVSHVLDKHFYKKETQNKINTRLVVRPQLS